MPRKRKDPSKPYRAPGPNSKVNRSGDRTKVNDAARARDEQRRQSLAEDAARAEQAHQDHADRIAENLKREQDRNT